MSNNHATGTDPCGREDLDPKRPDNNPGLSEIAYRIGTHSAFLRRMLWRIPRQIVDDPVSAKRLRPLLGLTARETDDPSIALMDAWAAALDVLSFYNERIANEGYLPTAQERRSMVELARSIGYELRPGVAASAHLTFSVEAADDPFRAVEVPVGTQAMSVPVETGALPQTYETVEAITARAEWNAIPARTEEPQHLALQFGFDPKDKSRSRLVLFDLDESFDFDAEINAENIEKGDIIEIAPGDDLTAFYPLSDDLDLKTALTNREEDADYNTEIEPVLKAIEINETFLRGTALGLAEGDRLLAVGARRDDDGSQAVAAAPFRIVEIEPDRDYDLTRVLLIPMGADPPPRRRRLPILRMAKLRIGTAATSPIVFNAKTVGNQVRRTAWTGATFEAFLKTQRWPRLQLMSMVRKPPPVTAPAVGDVTPGFHALRQLAGFFGNGAPLQELLSNPKETNTQRGVDPYEESWDNPAGGVPITVWSDSQGVKLTNAHAYLEREVEEIVPGQWVLLEAPNGFALPLRVASAGLESLADFASNGKATGLKLRRMDGGDLGGEIDMAKLPADLAAFRFRTARARVVSEHLPTAGAPIREDFAEDARDLALDTLYLDMAPGRPFSVSGERADAPGVTQSETLEIDEVLHIGGVTRIRLKSAPTLGYRRPSVRVNANVALATHGESQSEALGSGDAGRANQAFQLAKDPLTFVSAPTETGSATTLRVRVDGVAWAEVPSFYDASPQDPVYQVRIDDGGKTRVVFGDGKHGQRLPTGNLNVTAEYRAGIGVAGEAADETITLLKTRPLGIRGVTNPSRASGSGEPQSLEDARTRGPQSVRTLGRIVSLTDYADFARDFAGIGKARGSALWLGRERVAHLTVAPEVEGVFDQIAETLSNLRNAVAELHNQTHRFEIAPHEALYFKLSATITHDAAYVAEDVEAAARETLLERFGYIARGLAQSVSAAEVIQILDGVAGVAAVDLDDLSIYDEAAPETEPDPASLLWSRPARVERNAAGRDQILPAQLLTILEAGIDLTMEANDA